MHSRHWNCGQQERTVLQIGMMDHYRLDHVSISENVELFLMKVCLQMCVENWGIEINHIKSVLRWSTLNIEGKLYFIFHSNHEFANMKSDMNVQNSSNDYCNKIKIMHCV